MGPTVHTFVLPGDKNADPILAMHNPRNATITAGYMFFYPYNHGKKPFGIDFLIVDNHVGDIETMGVTFKAGAPDKVFYAQHVWGGEHKWNSTKIEKEDGHPVGYVATGSHATYTSAGKHDLFLGITTDYTAKKTKWETYKNIEMHLPWEWTHNKIENLRQWQDSPEWITQIYDWGNHRPSYEFFNFGPLQDGPTGFLEKRSIKDLMDHWSQEGFICEGIDTSRCLWPAGVFSKGKSYCLPGYSYSYEKKACFLKKPKNAGFDMCPIECWRGGDVCGDGWKVYSVGKSCFDDKGCQHFCRPHSVKLKSYHKHHYVCKKGTWINAADYSGIDTKE